MQFHMRDRSWREQERYVHTAGNTSCVSWSIFPAYTRQAPLLFPLLAEAATRAALLRGEAWCDTRLFGQQPAVSNWPTRVPDGGCRKCLYGTGTRCSRHRNGNSANRHLPPASHVKAALFNGAAM
jgi:hypothetical protein